MKLPAILTDAFIRTLPEEERKKLGRAGMTQQEAQAKYAAGEERRLQDDIATWLDHEQIYFESDRMDKRTSGKKGRADFRICANGRWLALEAKAGNGTLSSEQAQQGERLRKSGGVFAVVFSLKEAIAEVRKIFPASD